MISERFEHEVFTRRTFLLGLGQGLLLTTILGRLYYLQVLSGDHYKTLSDKNRIHARLLTPQRGQIFDRYGKIMATSRNAFNAYVIRGQSEDWEKLLQDAALHLNLSSVDIERIQRETKKNPKGMPILLKSNLNWQEVSTLEIHLMDMPGVVIEEGQNRYYPDPQLTCHVLGYVGAATEKEAQDDPMLALPHIKIGKSGLERAFDQSLRGTAGIKQQEVNARRQVVRDLDYIPGTPGTDLKTTLDLELQRKANEVLSAHESGVAIVLDCYNGDILAMASYPGFDSNLFTHGIRHQDWDTLNKHPRRALIHKAIAGQYPPGSTFKMITALAALKAKSITPQTTYTCRGYTELGQHRFHCWKKEGHGTLDLTNAIKHSCDIYFYQAAALVGVDAMAEMAYLFGLSKSTELGLKSEKSGLVPSRDWKSRALRRQWLLGETYNTGIGQGYLLATPLQLAIQAARLANGRFAIKPRLISADDPHFEPLNVSPEHLAIVREGFFKTVNEEGGTGFASRILEPDLAMAGKTGTSQVRRITLQERKLGIVNRADRPWEHKEHALFIGYAPFDNPRYACSVLIEHAGSGKYTVPLARDLLKLAQLRGKNHD